MAQKQLCSKHFKDGRKFPTVFGFRTGDVEVGDFDRGVLRTLGAELEDPIIGDRPRLFIRCPGVEGTQEDKISIIFSNPEQPFSNYKVPMILVRRESVDPALERAWDIRDEYRVPAPNAVLRSKVDPNTGLCVGVGWSYLESKPRAYPYNLGYSIEIIARKRLDANKILKKVLRALPPYGNIVVVDSLGCARTYFAQMTGFTDITDITDIMNRQPGYSVSLTVWGELNHDPEEIRKTAETMNVTLWQKQLEVCKLYRLDREPPKPCEKI
jgi:hypothetical protein